MKKIFIVVLLLSLISVCTAAEKRVNIQTGDSPQRGPKDAKVTIVEFIDFQ